MDSTATQHHTALHVARGGTLLASGRAFEYAMRFLVALLLARLLTAGDYGLYVLALGAGALLAVTSMVGLDTAMVRYVSIQVGRGDRAGLAGTLQVGLGLSAVVAVVMGLVCYLAADPVAMVLFDEPRLAGLLRLMALLIPFLTVSNVLRGVARGFERMDVEALSESVVQSLVRVGLLGLFALLGQFNVTLAVVIYGISDVAAACTFVMLLHRVGAPIREIGRPRAKREWREIFGFAFPLWLNGLLQEGQNRAQSIVLGVALGVASVGIFAIVERVTMLGQVALLSIFAAVKPTLARMYDQGDQEGMAGLYRTATRWTLTLYLPFFVVVVLLAEPILGIFSEAFRAGTTALIVLAGAELVNAATGICRSMIDMTGHTVVKLIDGIIYAVLIVGGSLILIPAYGVIGAVGATLIAITVVNVLSILQVWWLEGLHPFDRTFLKPVAAGLGAFGAGHLIETWWAAGTEPLLALTQAIAIGTTYLALLLVLGLPAEDRYILGRGMARAGRITGLHRLPARTAVWRGRSGS